jgi:hypothetical protein
VTVDVAFAEGLVDPLGRPASVVDVQPSPYATTHALFDVTVDVAGERVALVFKDLGDAAVVPEARGRRPIFLDDPSREVVVYTELLAPADLGTARCWAHGDHWLLLEKVPGVELYQVGEPQIWTAAARWLARFHQAMHVVATHPPATLLRHDARYHRRWGERAAAAAADPRVRRILDRHDPVVDALAALPTTVLHGDCWASNVLVDAGSDGTVRRVCPVDWETAAAGPGLSDLAALVMGWPDEERRAIALAYHDELGSDAPDATTFLADLDRCAVQLCVQWLGWSPGWVPPPEHRHDWVATAVDLLERLES